MISPKQFAEALKLKVIHPQAKNSRPIGVADLCRPGLQFAGYFDVFASERPQVIGKTEMAYLESLPEDVRRARLQRYFSYPIPCIVIARGMECPPALLDQAKQHASSDFTIPFDRQGLADYLGVDRSALSVEIGKLRREGVIESERSAFTLLR